MKPKSYAWGFQNACFAASRSLNRTQRRHATTTTSTKPLTSSSPSQRRWLRLTLITLTAAGVGAYLRWSQDSASSSTTLSPSRFTPYYLVSREPVSATGSLFTLKPPKSDGSNLEVYEDAWKTGVWSVMFKQPQLQIGRDYTPLPPVSSNVNGDECLRFFIRKDPFGEVSRYLHSLKIGAPIEVRGPRVECEIPPETQTILFIAGGTGIAPALQAGHTLLRRPDKGHKPRIHILWATRQREDCRGGYNDHTSAAPNGTRWSWLSWLFSSSQQIAKTPPSEAKVAVGTSAVVKELEALKAQYPGQVTVEYFVDEESTFIGKRSILDFTNSATFSLGQRNRNMILISGPEGFISYMAGPKQWAQGMELQGPLQGIIKDLNLHGWAVWKL
ncbi:hypothetical protein ASPCAL01181 [Aspergillus calidoustus]|uniref:FAD-binding FR-type domain-containing protein n=1 Tax=Aspergillus calidoustus TaxID=454130 RepID=A0A0U5FQ27_ASPCI|nr:hypothetical protein ASPCAL01181 [Aspergillus calidoustus]